jgi:hypothetical protein
MIVKYTDISVKLKTPLRWGSYWMSFGISELCGERVNS